MKTVLTGGSKMFNNDNRETEFKTMMPKLYGDWGVDSEVGKLRAVLMRRPGKEIEGITDPAAVAMKEIWDVGKETWYS